MSLRTRIADVLDDFGLRGAQTRDEAASAILDLLDEDGAA